MSGAQDDKAMAGQAGAAATAGDEKLDQEAARAKAEDEALVEKLKELRTNNKLDIWFFYTERVDKLAGQLWTMGTWLLGISSALLTLPFAAGFVEADPAHLLRVESALPTGAVALLGLLLCGYTGFALDDIREHTDKNRRRADFIRTGNWKASTASGSKLHGWRVLEGSQTAAAGAFGFLLGTALLSWWA